ncbi:MAG: phosphoribosylformylglycinamidine cyclo-ligase [Acidiferrobacterales bacterium]
MAKAYVSKSRTTSLTYRAAGVDIDAADALIETIKPIAAATARPGVLGQLGGFGGCFQLPTERYQQPVLVASTDGVGTKLKLAIELNRYNTIGIDLVAMCANDIIVQGAEPLFFLDYLATGHLDTSIATAIIEGIGTGCRLAGMALIGGETAEMPGVYADADFDLAGFAVGVVERTKIIDGSAVTANDIVVGIASDGTHANGYSLIRKIIETRRVSLDESVDHRPLGEVLLTPTRIYVQPLLRLTQALPVHAMAHITGGGLAGNLLRVLPAGISAVIDPRRWSRPAIFDWLQDNGNIEDAEMYRTFNCGIGMVVVVSAANKQHALDVLQQSSETAFVIGRTSTQVDDERVVIK